jgi:hypothetical protein
MAKGYLRSNPRSAGDNGHKGRQDDRLVTRVDLGEGGQVVGHRSRTGPGGGLGPGVNELQAGIPEEGR